jgi:hypothetical protein
MLFIGCRRPGLKSRDGAEGHGICPNGSEKKYRMMMHWSIVSVVFACLAALLWGWSAFINVPLLKSGYGALVSVTKDGSTEIGAASFYTALAKISRLNAGAALCAFLSAASQAIALYSTR